MQSPYQVGQFVLVLPEKRNKGNKLIGQIIENDTRARVCKVIVFGCDFLITKSYAGLEGKENIQDALNTTKYYDKTAFNYTLLNKVYSFDCILKLILN